jgi:hypothetical protein
MRALRRLIGEAAVAARTTDPDAIADHLLRERAGDLRVVLVAFAARMLGCDPEPPEPPPEGTGRDLF